MLATGGSLVHTVALLRDRGAPGPITVVCALAAPEGIQRLQGRAPRPARRDRRDRRPPQRARVHRARPRRCRRPAVRERWLTSRSTRRPSRRSTRRTTTVEQLAAPEDGPRREAGRSAVLAIVVGALAALMYATHRSGHWWGDDWALYIRQAEGLLTGTPTACLQENEFTVTMSRGSEFSPPLYPWGFPLMLVPFIAAFGVRHRSARRSCRCCAPACSGAAGTRSRASGSASCPSWSASWRSRSHRCC